MTHSQHQILSSLYCPQSKFQIHFTYSISIQGLGFSGSVLPSEEQPWIWLEKVGGGGCLVRRKILLKWPLLHSSTSSLPRSCGSYQRPNLRPAQENTKIFKGFLAAWSDFFFFSVFLSFLVKVGVGPGQWGENNKFSWNLVFLPHLPKPSDPPNSEATRP